jgi:hypothetical protein
MTNTTTLFPTPSPITSDESNKDSNLYGTVFYGVMGGVFVVCVLTGINEIYGPFIGIERSDPVLPEGVEPPTSYSFMGMMHNILDIQDAYRAETRGIVLNTDEIEICGVSDTVDQIV